jgi:EAL domain-containing protein (putative c-di-GMP-specific phosphodiesterase class I)
VFIPLAEERGLIQRLGALVLATACDDVRRWRQGLVDHAGLNLSVNISAVQLHDPAIVDQIGAAVEHSGLAPADLVLEVTESALAQDPAVAAERLRRLRQLGVRVAIDDFGTGHSSLSYLRQVPTDLIKIDKVFIDEIGPAAPGGSDGTLVRAILRLIDDVGLESVAEGIEQPEQAIELAAMGCRYGQGYAFCRPLPAPEMAGYLANTGSRWPSRT